MKIWTITVFCLVFVVACGGGSSEGDPDSGGDGDSDVDSDSDSDTDADGDLGENFRFGINGGHRNTSWGDDVQAELEAEAGCNSQRISLPERHLDQWGYDIEVNDMNAYASLGMSAQVGFLTSPIREHSTAPPEAADWELVHYIPSNLYEPTTLQNGEINPDNYWAKYVYETVSIYKDWIKVWEIWNEPDFVSDWNATLTWFDSPPTSEQLIRFNGSIFDYVRMLRVSREAALLADPEALIATGGIGYASFLSALLRYTDNPVDGSVTSEYPETGAAYFDVMSFHHYPIYTEGSADDGVAGYLAHFEDLKAELDSAGKNVVGFENTETGAPRFQLGTYPGGSAYARQYLMKVMISAQREGIHGIDWFVLSDGATEGASNDPYDFMGLYEDVVDLETIDQAVLTDTGIAYKTLGGLLSDALIDETRTADLLLANNLNGAAFVTDGGAEATAVWTIDDGSGAPELEVTLPSPVDCTVHLWDWSQTEATQTAASNGETVTVTANGEVSIILCEDAR